MFRDFINDGYITSAGVVWSLAMFIYACETVGGMESVALTDAVQCCFLMLSFISTYFLIEYKYGGFLGFFGGPESPQSCEASCMVWRACVAEPVDALKLAVGRADQ